MNSVKRYQEDKIEELEEQLTLARQGKEEWRSKWVRSESALAEARRELAEVETVLNAWHEAFGTTQLTHAKTRLETAEGQVETLRARLGEVEAGRDEAIAEAEDAIWGAVIAVCSQAWEDKNKLLYDCSPTELIIKIIDERDSLQEQLTLARQELSEARKNALVAVGAIERVMNDLRQER